MSGSIPPAFIREIVDMTDIVALVDSYVPLKKKGKDHWGLCPFCDDGSNLRLALALKNSSITVLSAELQAM